MSFTNFGINTVNGSVTSSCIGFSGGDIDCLPGFEVQLSAEYLGTIDNDPCNY